MRAEDAERAAGAGNGDCEAARDGVARDSRRDREAGLGGVVRDDHRTVGAQRKAGLGLRVTRDRQLAHALLERAARRCELELLAEGHRLPDLASVDVQIQMRGEHVERAVDELRDREAP